MTTAKRLNQALLKDIARRVQSSDLLSWIEVTTTALARFGWRRPGYIELGPRLLAQRGITECKVHEGLGDLAAIRARGDGTYTVLHHHYNMRQFRSMEDHRFWVAHEIAHTFWFNGDGSTFSISPRELRTGSDLTIEWLCNRAAAALLVPRGLLQSMLREKGFVLDEDLPPLHLIDSLARKLRVPPRLLARRWFHDILDRPLNVICLLPVADETDKKPTRHRLKILWEAIFSPETKLVRRLQGRILPSYALRHFEAAAEVQTCFLDGRWKEFVAQARGEQKSKPFSRLSPSPFIPGQIARINNQFVLAFEG